MKGRLRALGRLVGIVGSDPALARRPPVVDRPVGAAHPGSEPRSAFEP